MIKKSLFISLLVVVMIGFFGVVVLADVNGLGTGDVLNMVNGYFSGLVSAGSVSTGSLTVTGSTNLVNGTYSGTVFSSRVVTGGVDVGGGNITNTSKLNTIYYPQNGSELYNVANSCTSGCEIHLLSGTYTITQSVPLQTNMKIVGVGKDSIITVGNNFDDNLFVSNGRIHSFVLDNFEIDGNSGNQASGNCILFDGYYSLFNNMWITDCKENALYINSTSASSENIISGGRYSGLNSGIKTASGVNDIRINSISAVGGINSLYLSGSGGMVSNSMIYSGTNSGIYLKGSVLLYNNRISVTPIGVYLDATENNLIGLFDGVSIIGGNIFADITDKSIYVNTSSSYDTYLNVYNTILGSSNDEIYLDGLGDVRLKIFTPSEISYTDVNNKIVALYSVIQSYRNAYEYSYYKYNSDSGINVTYNTKANEDALINIEEAGVIKFRIWKDNFDASGIVNTADVVILQTGTNTNMKFYSDGTSQFGDGSSVKGFIMTSPDGTNYTCTMANGGNLTCS